MTSYYIDTCIWRDYLENREDNFRPLGEWAFMLFKLVEKEDGVVLYSSFVIDELWKKYTEKEINDMLKIIKNVWEVKATKQQIQEAAILGKIRGMGFSDAIHAILARDNNAILVTRDNHFIDLTDIATIKKPEELI